MAISEKVRIFNHLLRSDPGSGPVGFGYWLEGAAQAVLGKSPDDASKYVAANRSRLWNAFGEQNGALIRRGREPAFEVIDGRSLIFKIPGSRPDRIASSIVMHRAEVLRWISGLGDTKFEYFGAGFSLMVGAKRVSVSKRSGDRGADFYAIVPVWGNSDVYHAPSVYMRVVGQSKFYDSVVTRDKVDHLCQTVNNIRYANKDSEAQLPEWFRSTDGPIIGAILSPYGSSDGALTESRQQGLLNADAIDLAEAIIKSKKFMQKRREGVAVGNILSEMLSDAGWGV